MTNSSFALFSSCGHNFLLTFANWTSFAMANPCGMEGSVAVEKKTNKII